MIDISKFKKMSYNEAISSVEARNCGLYIVYKGDEILYIGKAAGQTLKRRLGEHLSFDNQFNTLTKKIGLMLSLPLSKIENIHSFMIENLSFILIPSSVHIYDIEGKYSFNLVLKEYLIQNERELIEEFQPQLNKRNFKRK